MVTHLNQRGRDSADGSETTEGMNEEKTGGQKKRKLEEEPTGAPSASSAVTSTCPSGGRQCVSMVIRVEHKEGVSWRNAGVGLTGSQLGLVLCFSVRAAVVGPVVPWRQDPKNTPVSERETTTERKVRKRAVRTSGLPSCTCAHASCLQVVLVFSGPSAGWFPVLQPGSSYRLVAADAQVNTCFHSDLTSGQRVVAQLLIGFCVCPSGSLCFDWLWCFCSVWGGALCRLHPSGQT